MARRAFKGGSSSLGDSPCLSFVEMHQDLQGVPSFVVMNFSCLASPEKGVHVE